MTDVRLMSERLSLTNGENYNICCSMAVLAEIEDCFGSMEAALGGGASWSTALKILTIMVNVAGRVKAYPEPFEDYTAERLGAVLPAMRPIDAMQMIMGLVMSAMGTEPVALEQNEDPN